MFELCALLAKPKVKKARKTPVKAISVGAAVEINGTRVVVTGRDTRYANAWFTTGSVFSFSRDMIKVL